MGYITDWIKNTRSYLAKEVRLFNGAELTPTSKLPMVPNWFFHSELGVPRGINSVEVRQYAKSGWVQMVTNTITRQIMVTEWDIVPKDDDNKENIEKYDADITKAKTLLEQPNRNGASFWDIWIPFLRDVLELDAGVVFKGRNGIGELVELFAHDGSRFLTHMDEYGIINGYYQYSFRHPQSAPRFFERKDIIYGRMNTNTELFPYGWSPLQSIQQEIELMIQSTRHNKERFKNNAIPDGIISVPMDLNQMQSFRNDWEQQVKGKPHKLVFHNTEASFTPISLTNKDMEWLDGQKWYFHLVFGAYGLSPQEAGFYENSNRATGESQERVTVKNAIKPYLTLIEERINREILPDLLGHDELQFTWFITDDVSEKIEHDQKMSKLNSNVYTINEVRAMEGRDPVEWGDRPMQFSAQERMAEMSEENPKEEDKKDKPQPKDRDKSKEEAEEEAKKLYKKPIMKKEMVVLQIEEIIKQIEAIDQEEAKNYADFLDKKFGQWEQKIFDFLDITLKDEIVEKDFMKKTFGEFLTRLFNSVNSKGFIGGIKAAIAITLKTGVEETEKELDVDIGIGPDFDTKVRVLTERQLEGFVVEGGRFGGIKGVAEDVRKDISEIVQKGLTNKEGLKEIKNQIKVKMTQLRGGTVKGEVTEGRVMKIARTETNRMMNQSKIDAFNRSGLKGKKVWDAFHDGRTSEVCKELNNQQVLPNELFKTNDGRGWEHPPAHPNCRSVVRFELDD